MSEGLFRVITEGDQAGHGFPKGTVVKPAGRPSFARYAAYASVEPVRLTYFGTHVPPRISHQFLGLEDVEALS